MKRLLFVGCFLSSAFKLAAQENNTYQKASLILKTVERHHFKPVAIDDHFSQSVFTEFMQQLDPYSLYFSLTERTILDSYQFTLDDELKNQKGDFIALTTSLYQKSLQRTDSLLQTFRKKTWDYQVTDSIYLERHPQPVSLSKLTHKWEQIIKLHALDLYYTQVDSVIAHQKPLSEKMSALQDQAVERQICKINSKTHHQQGLEHFVEVSFLKAVATAFDPHTNYFTDAENQAFESALATKAQSFGFTVTQNDLGEIEIDQLIPGSSAWNSNQINEKDIILNLKTGHVQYDFGCITIEEAMTYLTDTNLKEATFTLKKKNGTEIEVLLQKNVTDVVENKIQSYLLTGEQSVGYIYLPTFYSEINELNLSFNGCANDLAKELILLKKEGVKGLILDLRNNGGGSMLEAVLMSGIFVDYGTVSLVQSRDEDPQTLKDLNRGIVFNEPLIILVNEFSASASELFAAAMQDLNRAILVGTPTFGKSSFQEVQPLNADRNLSAIDRTKDKNGYLKITKGLFFRVTGDSHQKQGIIPDIILPSLYEGTETGERFFPTALSPARIDKKIYYFPLPALPVSALQGLSAKRIANDSRFQEIKQNSILFSKLNRGFFMPLRWDSYHRFQEWENQITKDVITNPVFEIEDPKFKATYQLMETSQKSKNHSKKQTQNDLYLNEAYHIISDLISLSKN